MATSPENEPDLIAVVATNGKIGYANRTDLTPQHAANPAEAVAMTMAARAGTGHVRGPIPVYESDGRTVIGEFAFSERGTGAGAIAKRTAE